MALGGKELPSVGRLASCKLLCSVLMFLCLYLPVLFTTRRPVHSSQYVLVSLPSFIPFPLNLHLSKLYPLHSSFTFSNASLHSPLLLCLLPFLRCYLPFCIQFYIILSFILSQSFSICKHFPLFHMFLLSLISLFSFVLIIHIAFITLPRLSLISPLFILLSFLLVLSSYSLLSLFPPISSSSSSVYHLYFRLLPSLLSLPFFFVSNSLPSHFLHPAFHPSFHPLFTFIFFYPSFLFVLFLFRLFAFLTC